MDVAVLLGGVVVMQLLAALLVNRMMFHPVKDGYDRTLNGYVDVGTNGVAVAARMIGSPAARKVILYCHGNAEDITAIDGRFGGLIANGCAVVSFDYPGYGLSGGKPNEMGCYENAHRVYDWLIHCKGFKGKDIVVVGYSIGTGVATELAASCDIGGLWLEAPYLSAPRTLTRRQILFTDPFPNIKRIGQVNCPLVILHGTADSVIPYSQGRALYGIAPNPKWFIPVQNAGHSDFIDRLGSTKYDQLLLAFVMEKDIPKEFVQ